MKDIKKILGMGKKSKPVEDKQDISIMENVDKLLKEGKSLIEISKSLDITLNSVMYWADRIDKGGKPNIVDEVRKALDSDSYETYDLAKRYTKSPQAINRLVTKAEMNFNPAADWVKRAAKSGILYSRMKRDLKIKTLDRAKEVVKENFKDCIVIVTKQGDDFLLTPVHSSKDETEWLNIDTSQRKFDYYISPENNYLCVKFNDNIPVDKIKIVQLSDIHVGSIYFRKELFMQFVDKIKKDPYCFIILTGDLIECINKASAGGSWEQYENINEQVEEFFNLMRPIADRVLASIEGNHEFRVERNSEFSLSRVIANMLRVPFFNVLTYIDLNFKDQRYTIAATHFYAKNLFGQAQIVNRVRSLAANLANPCQLYLSGHTHSGWVQTEYSTMIIPGKGRVPFEYVIANSGSFTQHTGSYSEKAGYQWTPQSVIYFTIDNLGSLEVFQHKIRPL